MANQGSVAPQERVNITYKPATGGAQSAVELPLKLLFIGDYTGRHDERPLEERKPVNIDKDNFEQVLAEHRLALQLSVPNTLLENAPGAELSVTLRFTKLADFGPGSVAERIPELRKLLELRQALTALKGPMGNVPAFRKRIQSLLGDGAERARLLGELRDEAQLETQKEGT